MPVKFYGFDPGLRHGVLLLAEFDEVSKTAKVDVCFEWKKKDTHLSLISTPLEISVFTNTLISKLTDPALALGIEYDPQNVYMRNHSIQVVIMAFMIGYLSRGAQSRGLPIVYVKPTQLKEYFGISLKEGKEYVNRTLPDLYGWVLPEIIYKSSDHFDAFLIAYFTWRMMNEPVPASPVIPG